MNYPIYSTTTSTNTWTTLGYTSTAFNTVSQSPSISITDMNLLDDLKFWGATPDEAHGFLNIWRFLCDNPEFIPKKPGGSRKTPSMDDLSDLKTVFDRWVKPRRDNPTLLPPKTIDDPAIITIIDAAMVDGSDEYGTTVHRNFMAAENVLGVLLEKYIASELEQFGWVWCSGETVKSVDFLKNDNGWIPIQVKNRSNSENSSSRSVRHGTPIKKWHRIQAYSGKTNWEKFPAPELQGVLTEQGFQKFIRDSI